MIHGGVGALFVRRRAAFRSLHLGGGHENNRRAGTENAASISGFGKAAELAATAVDEQQTRVRALRDRFEETLLERVPDASVNGDRAGRLPNASTRARRSSCSISNRSAARPAPPAGLVPEAFFQIRGRFPEVG